eukprot:scaffold67284_cov66-Phaeocystis_antarctica.AAC.7
MYHTQGSRPGARGLRGAGALLWPEKNSETVYGPKRKAYRVMFWRAAHTQTGPTDHPQHLRFRGIPRGLPATRYVPCDSPMLLQKTSSARSTCGSSSTSCPPPATVSRGRHSAPTSRAARCSASASRSGTVVSSAPWHWKTGSVGLSAAAAATESSPSCSWT